MSIPAVDALQHAVLHLKRLIAQVRIEIDIDRLRGLEGEAAQVYFSVFNHLIRIDTPALRFQGRSRRPPRDAIHALIPLLYTLLANDCRSALETVVLNLASVFLPLLCTGRPTL